MWEAKIINIAKVPGYIQLCHKQGDIMLMNEDTFKYNKKVGAVEGIKHFRYKSELRECKECGRYYNKRKRIPWKKLKRPKNITEDDWNWG